MSAIPTHVLSDRFTSALRGRHVEAAVFTTFAFEPGFFELEVLPLLFDDAFSQAEKVRLVMLEERLRECGPIAVYYDHQGLKRDASAKLDVRRIAMRRKGFFHPKVALVLVSEPADEDDPEAGRVQSLVVAVLSANLTQAGWWENVECAFIDEIAEGQRCSYHEDILGLLATIHRGEATLPSKTKEDRRNNAHAALERIRAFLASGDNVVPYVRATRRGRLNPRLFYGQDQALPDFLPELLRLPASTYHLEILSPYFGDDSAGAVDRLIEALEPKTVRMHLPKAEDGSGLCSQAFYQAVEGLGVEWAELPDDMLKRGRSASKDVKQRFVHAKVYRLWSRAEGREILVVGSPNLTDPGHSVAEAGNLEAAMVFEPEVAGKLGFWLEPVVQAPHAFDGSRMHEPIVEEEDPLPLHLELDWGERTARAYWEQDTKPGSVELHSAGASLGVVPDLPPGQWVGCDADLTEALFRSVASTCFVSAKLTDGRQGTVLVREEGMAHKPSLLTSLTAEEILRYWSMLTPEQRQALIEEKMAEDLRAQGLLPANASPAGAGDSMFDRFAGIFHAFHQLDAHVRRALEAKQRRTKEAVYRLYGAKHDSLPHLVDKVLEPGEDAGEHAGAWDPVHRLMTLLTATQLLRGIARDFPAFVQAHARKHAEVERKLGRRVELEGALDLGADGARFLEWLESQLLGEVGR